MKQFGNFLILSLIFFAIACKRNDSIDKSEDAQLLFERSADLLNNTIREIEAAKDSSQIDSLKQIYEKQIIEINFSVPPQTDFLLTEEENDSIYRLLQKLDETVQLKYNNFSKNVNDTTAIITPDTIK